MREFKTDKRLEKIKSVVRSRQQSLHLVIENIHDPHNVSAIFRTCDSVGIPKVSLIYSYEKFPKIGKKSSASAFKWIEKEKFKSVDDCYSSLRENGFKIFATTIKDDPVDLYDIDFTQKIAVVMGNEHRGVSDEAASQADERFLIPMVGMVQSLNVSVAAAVIIYEALRQRLKRGMYDNSELSKKEVDKIIDKWCEK